jgi:hypothetical protein
MYYRDRRYCNVDVLKGKTLSKVTGGVGDDEITFVTTEGETYRMLHNQDCCESVSIQDIIGDLQDLVGSEILIAEEVEGESPADFDYEYLDSYTWTFYKFATIKGYVDIRWFGSSNGYYSEGVDFCKMGI